MENQHQIRTSLNALYPSVADSVHAQVAALITRWQQGRFAPKKELDSADIMMIAYGDAICRKGEAPLATLKSFADSVWVGGVNLIHLLPVCPYSSDDGFSVLDFRQVRPGLGTWEDIERLRDGYGLMLDAVVNHVSRGSAYFKDYLAGGTRYADFFIEADATADYAAVVRPRTLPLFTEFETLNGPKSIWTTFSADQVDLNYRNPAVLLEILDVLLFYASQGARFIRLDAIGFAWKEPGTSCMNLPGTHELVKLMRAVLQSCAPGCGIVTETNVPHADNIAYFGNGHNEAAMVYQFPLPPLVLWSFLAQDATSLTRWAASLRPTTAGTTYFNFLASHDGIGLRPVEGILGREEQAEMVAQTLARGGQVSNRALPGGGEAPYELNINFLDAVAADAPNDAVRAQKFMASQCILLSVMGMPAVYYHSLLGSRGDAEGYARSGNKRRINRQKLDAGAVLADLADPSSLRSLVSEKFKRLIDVRKSAAAFAPNSPQQVLALAPGVFALLRGEAAQRVLALVNVTGRALAVHTGLPGVDLISGEACGAETGLSPWQYRWIKL